MSPLGDGLESGSELEDTEADSGMSFQGTGDDSSSDEDGLNAMLQSESDSERPGSPQEQHTGRDQAKAAPQVGTPGAEDEPQGPQAIGAARAHAKDSAGHSATQFRTFAAANERRIEAPAEGRSVPDDHATPGHQLPDCRRLLNSDCRPSCHENRPPPAGIWRPSGSRAAAAGTGEADVRASVHKRLRGLLNRLTEDNMQVGCPAQADSAFQSAPLRAELLRTFTSLVPQPRPPLCVYASCSLLPVQDVAAQCLELGHQHGLHTVAETATAEILAVGTCVAFDRIFAECAALIDALAASQAQVEKAPACSLKHQICAAAVWQARQDCLPLLELYR